MTFKEYSVEIDPIKEEWYVCEYLYYDNPIVPSWSKQFKYWVTRSPDLKIYKDTICQKPLTLIKARNFRDVLNKLTGN